MKAPKFRLNKAYIGVTVYGKRINTTYRFLWPKLRRIRYWKDQP